MQACLFIKLFVEHEKISKTWEVFLVHFLFCLIEEAAFHYRNWLDFLESIIRYVLIYNQMELH